MQIDGKPYYIDTLDEDRRNRILDTTLTVYVCEGTPPEIQSWFETINIAGMPLNKQELLNSVYAGPFVTTARQIFSNSNDARMNKRRVYAKGDPKR